MAEVKEIKHETNAEGVVIIYKPNGHRKVVGMIQRDAETGLPVLYKCEPYAMEEIARLINPQHSANGNGRPAAGS